mgnify:CR=1 FL=1
MKSSYQLKKLEVVICGGMWKAWGRIGRKLFSSEDGHSTAEKALAQLQYRVRRWIASR